MHYEESVRLGERLLNQALTGLKPGKVKIDDNHWKKLLRDGGAKSRQEILADIGLGKRLAVVVARRLLSLGGPLTREGKKIPGTVTIRGTEGMAVQFAKCCRPIPGDPIIGFIKKGQGMVIHTHDCSVIAKIHAPPEKILDVEWDPQTSKSFDVSIELTVANQRGVLAKVAAEIAEAGSNIDNVSMEEGEGSDYTGIHFTLQVTNRMHLAQLIRSLRRIPEVVRITRVKG